MHTIQQCPVPEMEVRDRVYHPLTLWHCGGATGITCSIAVSLWHAALPKVHCAEVREQDFERFPFSRITHQSNRVLQFAQEHLWPLRTCILLHLKSVALFNNRMGSFSLK
jgi:hypothetical protein